jgi:hypothetical protein
MFALYGTDCKNLTSAKLAAASPVGESVIANFLDCPGGVSASGPVTLKGDVAIFAQKFDFTNLTGPTFQSSTTAQRRLWFITPDNTVPGLPTCDASYQGNFSLKNNFKIAPTVSALLYTPCKFDAQNNFVWRGQLYANGANAFFNNTAFEYLAVGLPGADLDTGLPVAGGSIGLDAKLGGMLSIRDLKSGR